MKYYIWAEHETTWGTTTKVNAWIRKSQMIDHPIDQNITDDFQTDNRVSWSALWKDWKAIKTLETRDIYFGWRGQIAKIIKDNDSFLTLKERDSHSSRAEKKVGGDLFADKSTTYVIEVDTNKLKRKDMAAIIELNSTLYRGLSEYEIIHYPPPPRRVRRTATRAPSLRASEAPSREPRPTSSGSARFFDTSGCLTPEGHELAEKGKELFRHYLRSFGSAS
jgi:hypothetical protein